MPLILHGQQKDLGGFSVARILPQPARRQLGPFVFLDEFGPASFAPGEGMDVRPHPHIGLATITWLFDGAITHRDSLGTVIDITPGAINWMTAGRGITHSERTPHAVRAAGHRLHGLQAWVALPRSHEETAPAFQHVAAEDVPVIDLPHARLHLIAGQYRETGAAIAFPHPIIYIDAQLQPGAQIDLPEHWGERGLYPLTKGAALNGEPIAASTLAIADAGPATLAATAPVRVIILGGVPYPEPRFLEWNFVHHDKARIAEAVEDWREHGFRPVPGDDERIPY